MRNTYTLRKYKKKIFKKANRNKLSNKTYIKLIILLAAFIILCVEINHLALDRTVSEKTEDIVLTSELAGYLQIIPLTPEETRALILPELGEYLTGEDIYFVLNYLDLKNIAESVREQIDFDEKEEITHEKWCRIYELILDNLGLSDEVKCLQIQYLGALAEEKRVMADSGNYDCDLESIDFTYGQKYEVYIYGNRILGRKAVVNESVTENTGENVQSEQIQAEIPEQVRIMLTQDNNQKIYRENVYLKGTEQLQIMGDDGSLQDSDGGQTSLTSNAEGNQVLDCGTLMAQWNTGHIIVSSEESGKICITNSEGGVVSSYYRGTLHLYKGENGIWIVNELSMDEYLYGVVPGEMPESFESEALKVQAVCARTYACRLVVEQKYAEYNADLNDTTDCQVYLPSKENEKSITAVNDTKGMVLTYQGWLASIYYFSTSCGYTAGMEVWGSEQIAYLQPVSLLTGDSANNKDEFDTFIRRKDISAYDGESRFFRWSAVLDLSEKSDGVKQAVQNEVNKNAGKLSVTDLSGADLTDCSSLGEYQSLSIASRGASGAVTDLQIQFSNGIVHIYNENAIRSILGAAMTSLLDKNDDSVHTLNILPSAMFSADWGENGVCVIYGGGLGHGIGMSQYGADGMAKAGMHCDEILTTFFPGTEVSCE